MSVADDKTISYGVSGPTSKGEHGTVETCRTLVAALNQSEGRWNAPMQQSAERYIDCLATNDTGHELRIQVIRAIADPKFWRRLNREGRIDESGIAAKVLAAAMYDAILKKGDAIPDRLHGAITLAVNAQDAPACASHEVIDSFRATFLEETRRYGFAAVWVVGPTPQLVGRLD